jgi:acyl-CoA thioesterase-1
MHPFDQNTARGLRPIRRRALFGLAASLALAGPAFAQTAAPPAGKPRTIAALGDSLTAGYGLPAGQGFVPRLEAALRAKGRDVKVLNHGVSGDTSAGGLARIDWMLGDKPDLVLVALGANDALRGLDPASTRANLEAIVQKLKAAGVSVVLLGMLAPRNWGAEYARGFDAIYPDLAKTHALPLYPFFLDGVAADAALNQPDGIHPNAKGVDIMVERTTPTVIEALDRLPR